MDGGIELTALRTADDAELKPSSDSVMGIEPISPPLLLQIPSLLANMSMELHRRASRW